MTLGVNTFVGVNAFVGESGEGVGIRKVSSWSLSWLLVLSLSFVAMSLFAPSAFAVKEGEPAPEISLKSLTSGEQVSLSGLKGSVVFVDVWASWCPPCRTSLPLFNDMYKELAQYGLEILAVNVDENPQDGIDFVTKFPVDYKVLADPKGVVAETYGVPGMPTSYLIDRLGVVKMVHVGFKEKDMVKIKGEIIKLLGR